MGGVKNFVRAAVVGSLSAMTVVTPVAAGPLEDGDAAFNRADLTTALDLYRPLAEQGNATAQYKLGMTYQLLPNDAEAMRWLSKSAEQGNSGAQSLLGFSYEEGLHGTKRDVAEAIKWFLKAADQGSDSAEYRLGELYHQGVGVARNDSRSRKWWLKSATQGNGVALRIPTMSASNSNLDPATIPI